MTTLIADRRSLTMGADREASDYGLRCAVRKVRRTTVHKLLDPGSILDGGIEVLVGIAGLYNPFELLIDWVRRGMSLQHRPPPLKADSVGGLVLTHKALYTVDSEFCVAEEEFTPYYALGTGAKVGLAALYLGCTVEKALAVAHRFDVGTGVETDILSLDVS